MDRPAPAAYGDAFADVYDDWYQALPHTDACADHVAALVPGGRVLELGVGTGRLAIAMLARGLDVVGLDASGKMLDALRRKQAAAATHVVLADMAALPLAPGSVDLTLIAFNTLFNLPDEHAQLACLRALRRVVRPQGHLVIETIVFPDVDRGVGGVDASIVEVDRVVLTASRLDPASRSVEGQHVEITEGGIRLRPWRLHYLLPGELDALAAECGWRLDSRHEAWDRQPYREDSEHQVARYRPA